MKKFQNKNLYNKFIGFLITLDFQYLLVKYRYLFLLYIHHFIFSVMTLFCQYFWLKSCYLFLSKHLLSFLLVSLTFISWLESCGDYWFLCFSFFKFLAAIKYYVFFIFIFIYIFNSNSKSK